MNAREPGRNTGLRSLIDRKSRATLAREHGTTQIVVRAAWIGAIDPTRRFRIQYIQAVDFALPSHHNHA
jgi:hypothetical protein